MQGGGWWRAAVSQDSGPGSATIKVRLDPDNEFSVVQRKLIRLAPRPASINVGDRMEWYGASATSFQYVPATVKQIGTGSMQGYYLMAMDKYPNSPTYTKAENLWTLPGAAASIASSGGPVTGKYRCFAGQIFLGSIELRADGTYTASAGPAGRYQANADTKTLIWESGWAKSNGFEGKLEGNAFIRLARAAYCSHE